MEYETRPEAEGRLVIRVKVGILLFCLSLLGGVLLLDALTRHAR